MTKLELDVFSVGWSMICTSKREDVDLEQVSAIYPVIAEELTVEEFWVAVRLAIRNCKRLPTVKELVDSVKPSEEVLAARHWMKILEQEDFSKPTIGVPQEAVSALQVIGGRKRVIEAPQSLRETYYRRWLADYLDRVRVNQLVLMSSPQRAIGGGE